MTTTLSAIWLCVDCHLTLAGYSDAELGYTPEREPLTLLADEDVTEGLPVEDHATDCPVFLTGDWEHECECAHDSFSMSSCDGCGSHLAGDRYGATIVTRD